MLALHRVQPEMASFVLYHRVAFNLSEWYSISDLGLGLAKETHPRNTVPEKKAADDIVHILLRTWKIWKVSREIRNETTGLGI